MLETDGSLLVEVVNNQQDRVSLVISYRGNGLVSVHDNVMHQQRNLKCLSAVWETRGLVWKFPDCSEGAVRRHWAAKGLTVKQHFYLGAMRRLHAAVHRNDQEMAVLRILIH